MAKIADIKNMRELLTSFYCTADSAHVAHINTRSFAQHKALDMYYNFVFEFKDRLVEYMVGKGYVGQISLNPIESNEDVVSEGEEACELLRDFAKANSDDTLINMAADFQETTNKLKYLLMLK
jgi:hypothetical protein